MRNLTPAALAAAQEQFASEPINVIQVQWDPNGVRHTYADKQLTSPPVAPYIVGLSNLDYIVNIQSGSDSAEIEVILSDIDGHLKNIIDTVDVHKRDVWVYQYFDSIPFEDRFLLFHGVINSPIVWNEGDRTLSFTVINKIEDAEIGFSIEEGQFTHLPRDLIGKPWPLKFGTTFNVPALRLSETVRGTLATGVGIADYWLPLKANSDLTCPQVFVGYQSRYEGIAPSLIITPAYQPDPSCLTRACQLLAEAEIQYEQQVQYEFDQIRILDGENFPQNVELSLDIGGATFVGSFGTPDARTFTITSRIHPEFDELGPATDENLDSILSEEEDGIKTGCGLVADGGATGFGTPVIDGTEPDVGAAGSAAMSRYDPSKFDDATRNLYQHELSFNRFNAIPNPGFFWAETGSDVRLAEDQEVVYISNILPETVHRVAAFRQLDSQRRLVTVPREFYTVRVMDYGSYQVTEIVFANALSNIDSTWDDDIYVTSTSTVGPNTVDIMEWLIGKYTKFAIDPASFNHVRARLAVYPMDFPYLDRRNVLDALRELAFQARCAIYLRDDRFYLKYLPEEPAPNYIISGDDVDLNSLSIVHTDTEDVVTKLVAEWKRDYAIDDPNIVITRHNVARYGVQEKTYDFYAYNEVDYVVKSSTFWAIRKGNTWKKLAFSTPPQTIELETFDTVGVNVPALFPGQVNGMLEQADWDSESRTMTFLVHTYVKSGDTAPYPFFHPADISTQLIWPDLEDWQKGIVGSGPDAPGFDTIAPAEDHPLGTTNLPTGFSWGGCPDNGTGAVSREFQFRRAFAEETGNASEARRASRTCGDDKGDPTPSDQDDSIKEKDTETDAEPEIPGGDVYKTPEEKLKELGGKTEAEKTKETAEAAYGKALTAEQRASAANEAAEGPGSGTENGDPGVDDLPGKEELEERGENEQEGGSCIFTATIFIREATVLAGENGAEGPGFLGSSDPVRRDEIHFRTCKEARQIVCAVLEAYNQRQDAQDITKGEQLPTNAVSSCPNYFPPCDDEEPESGLPEPIGSDTFRDTSPGASEMDLGDLGYLEQIADILRSGACDHL